MPFIDDTWEKTDKCHLETSRNELNMFPFISNPGKP